MIVIGNLAKSFSKNKTKIFYICNKKLLMDIWVKIIIAAIILHLVFGFGWLIFKLSPRRKSGNNQDNSE